MDRESLRKAQEASRTAFLREQTRKRERAAAAVLEEKISEIEAGVVPHSLLEIDLLSRRAQEVRAAEDLQRAAQLRQGLLDDDKDDDNNNNKNNIVGDVGREQNPMDCVESPGSGPSLNFVAMDRTVINERVARREFVEERTEEQIARERAAALQGQHQQLQEQRRALPIFRSRNELLSLVRSHPVVVIVGETGSGKTTQVLQYLYEERFNEEGDKRLICTQPRRIAAMSVAERVAKEMDSRCGSLVGYRVRFDDRTGPTTRVLFMTDGMMLKELIADPDLNGVAAIMIDEAHERSLNTDILLGVLKDIIRRNKELKVIVASATINADKFSQFFDGAPIFTVRGRTFPVEVSYLTQPVVDYVRASVESVLQLHATKPLPGDILVFLPGQDDIEACSAAVLEGIAAAAGQLRPLLVLPIYSSLPPREQRRIYEVPPPHTRKVVIATNIAETSITIDGVVYVVDCGLCKQDFYNPRAMVEELRVVPTSQASATQRTGRAGRTKEGECYRLYTPYTFRNELPPETVPEILRCSLSAVVLQLKALGIHNLLQFEFIDSPSTASLERALDHLYFLGAMRQDGRLTRTGTRMAEFPMEPSLSKCIVRASALGCLRHMAIAAAMLSLDAVFVTSRDPNERRTMRSARDKLFSSGNGDVAGYVRLMEEWLRAGPAMQDFCQSHHVNPKSLARARDVLDQILRTCERLGLDGADKDGMTFNMESLTRALLAGFFMNVSRLNIDRWSYVVVRPLDVTMHRGGIGVDDESAMAEIHPSSFLHRAGMPNADDGAPRGAQAAKAEAVLPILRERPGLVVFTQLRRTTKRYMMHVTAIPSAEWVMGAAPVNYFTKEELEINLRKRQETYRIGVIGGSGPQWKMLRTSWILRMMQLHSTPTPNPLCFAFHIPSMTYENFIPSGQTCDVPHRGLAWVHPLSDGLFEQYAQEIASVYIAPRQVAITVYEHVDWSKIEWSLSSFIGHYLVLGNMCVAASPEYALLEDDLVVYEEDSEVLQCVKELLREQVRPMVQRDGGDVKLLNYNEKTGVVSLAMLGACRTCPSSGNTLKFGIERVMKHFLPEVTEVVEAKGHKFYEEYGLLFDSEKALRQEAMRIDTERRRKMQTHMSRSLMAFECLNEPDGDA